MAEEKDDKFSLPLAGVLALVAMVSGLIVYQNPLKTSRPIDLEAEKKAASQDRVQSRLWQDPFEAVRTHQFNESERLRKNKSLHEIRCDDPYKGERTPPHCSFKDLTNAMREAGGLPNFRVLPVFMDGNPYASGVQSRLKDRYAVVSALGAAGYMPESPEHIRYFLWPPLGQDGVIPIERFIPKAKIRVSRPDDVLILWLKDQDFSEKPLDLMNKLIRELNAFNGESSSSYTILGPRFSSTLSAMLTELKDHPANQAAEFFLPWRMPRQDFDTLRSNGITFFSPWLRPAKDFGALKNIVIYSYWATAADVFLLDNIPGNNSEMSIKELFELANISLVRTIGTDAVLAEQLVNELKRREVDLFCIEPAAKCTAPRIALISEWDTLYGRALPRTFVAVAEHMAKNKVEEIDEEKLKSNIDSLRKDEWPLWITRYSYLAGLDGELPPKKDDKETREARAKDKTEDKDPRARRGMEEVAEGRDQLDYVQRLAAELKLDEANYTLDGTGEQVGLNPVKALAKLIEDNRKKEFRAIGVLGSDVYDKLLILQALRKKLPRAIFFTMDLDARLIHPTQWQWTRNLVVASHFGLQLDPQLQNSIPPFRDNSQTVLFYSVLRALGNLQLVPGTLEQPPHFKMHSTAIGGMPCFPADKTPPCFSPNIKPRLYEIGRHAAVDISPDLELMPREEFKSIHAARRDLDDGKMRLPVEIKTIIWITVAILFLGLCAKLISSEAAKILGTKRFWIAVLGIPVVITGLVAWAMMADGAKGEPFVLTEGVSVWPTVAIYLLAIFLCGYFYCYSRELLKEKDKELSKRFGLPESKPVPLSRGWAPCLSQPWRWWGIHRWYLFLWAGWCRCYSIPRWHQTTKGETDVAKLWRGYRRRGELEYSLRRILPQFVFFSILVWMLFWKLGLPTIPCRGQACFEIYRLIAYLGVAAALLLMLYVIDTTRLCRWLVRLLCEKKFPWCDDSQMRNEADKRGVDKAYLNELMCINLIAKWTAVISKLLYFPFIILFLIGVARYTYIDNFDLPADLVIIYGVVATYAVGIVIALRVSAAKAKRAAVSQLREKLPDKSSSRFRCSSNIEEKRHQIERVIKEIQDNHEGAFLPFHKYPVLGAIAVPAGGTGLLYLIEYLVTSS